ncbi:30S ribosomal protein S2 [Candidatus Berkelbacteria bacterium CG_4_9_14_3_um_filter_39_23]|uniref:Small ribosomal subunit protein uS2 n=2 Tax=Candidatus Berkelbacteria TaxID=1618330 RepID=A0A2M7CIN6_9BACT|nr:MAG: 30S ribosomal protein S2 [Candidatus Berkelbacteria bacterium CG11_big_fil_rev_8_21_14_0_20_40_23]PIV25503.1 MAG: 30S ribosomal protein S2 [Candidatus Berkelbacteria bacterium CG03_land_8_20_14_0_80_40_36]PIX30522.1 MAG: 30S ribosomal protein S2 [Candidatus Berkelbacteria bacterium CG_4_8_14_3_um_filter_39_27]PIZ29001.1 MAG: 30S ribosomal protein S2 [Candidatus Berkelbacteria bacterium CG_4_10_14_0_8_um_filter_39_42]PJB51669.1 MAG: 30S ribosomal protein S2 [Candidatus Berkelbacteria bac
MIDKKLNLIIPQMPNINELFAVGAHFGHPKQKHHPKSKPFIFNSYKGINIINLEKTISYLEKALVYIADEIKSGRSFLLVGTKNQISPLLGDVARSLNLPYINHKWLGGTLTNFETIKKNITRLVEMEKEKMSDEFQKYTKKEKSMFDKNLAKLKKNFDGLRNVTKLPDNLFVVDAWGEATAISEARSLGIPVVAITDTNFNPEEIDYPIPANDDVAPSVSLVLNLVKETIEKNLNQVKNLVAKPADKIAKKFADKNKEKND